MTERAGYEEFLAQAKDGRNVSIRIRIRTRTFILVWQKALCENKFRAIEQAMMYSNACDITGIVAIACARHGCFAPNSIVNLYRGEQQKNVDWAFLESLRTTRVQRDQGVMLFYDIPCQYFVYLDDRIGHLLPPGLQIDRAIGLFHVHGHKEECFFRYSPSFIPFCGVVAGEILESLWANLNTITPAARTATLAHRTEIIDDHASDSNYKKAISMGGLFFGLCGRRSHQYHSISAL